jgi:HK97 family phage prohead protease
MRAVVNSVDAEKRTVELIFSTGAEVLRYDYMQGKRYREVLSMDPKHVRLDRLNGGAPLLDSHSAWSVGDVLGVVEANTARIEKGRGLVTVRFSARDSVADIWKDVQSGIIRSVSIGYAVYKSQEDTPKDGGIPTRTAIDWEPFEVSMVPMPADAGAHVRGANKAHTNPCVIVTPTEDADRIRRFRLAEARH